MLDNGDKLEKLELIDINGQPFDITNYKGKKLAIYFWASW
jgi:peroxiredoxin